MPAASGQPLADTLKAQSRAHFIACGKCGEHAGTASTVTVPERKHSGESRCTRMQQRGDVEIIEVEGVRGCAVDQGRRRRRHPVTVQRECPAP